MLFFIPTAVAAVTVYGIKKQIKWKIVLKVALWGLLGAVVGIYFADLLGGKLTSKLFGGLLVVMGVIEIFSKKGCGRDK